MLSNEPSCGTCFLYSEKKKTCPIDGRHRMKTNGCYINYRPKDEHVQKTDATR